jgi:phage portal protein BeeE
MSLWDRITTRYRAGSTFWEGEASGAAMIFTSAAGGNREQSVNSLISEAQRMYQTNGVVWSTILARIMVFSQARFTFQSKVDKRTFGKPTLSLLEYPWPNGATSDLLARMEQDVSLAGNAYIWKPEPDRLVRIPPNEVTIISKEEDGGFRTVLGYDWDPQPLMTGGRSEKARFIPVEEIGHYAPIPDPAASFRGMSWLTPVIREVLGDKELTDYKTNFLSNSATPSMLVKYPIKLRGDTIDSIVQRFTAKYAGANGLKTLVLDQGADATPMGSTFDQLNLTAVMTAGAERICAAGGVPMDIAGLQGATSNAEWGASMRRFADITLRFLWESACSSLEPIVDGIPDQGVRLWYDVTDVAALRQSETERAQTIQVKAAAILTLEQAGYTRESVVAAVVADDLTLLVAEPLAPPPGISEQLKDTDQLVDGESKPVTLPNAPQIGPRVSRPQTPATVAAKPNTFAHIPSVNAAKNGSG